MEVFYLAATPYTNRAKRNTILFGENLSTKQKIILIDKVTNVYKIHSLLTDIYFFTHQNI